MNTATIRDFSPSPLVRSVPPQAGDPASFRARASVRSPDRWVPIPGSQLRDAARCLLAGVALGAVMLAPGAWAVYGDYAAERDRRAARAEMMQSHDRMIAAPPGPALEVSVAAHGRDLFLATCAACHRADGTGVQGLGKDLTRSWFVASRDDASLQRFLATGRSSLDAENTTGILMPARGGQPSLADKDLADIVVYVRGLQDPRILPDLPEPKVIVAEATEAEKAAALVAAGGDAELAEYIAHGSKLFANSCTACHAKDARGVAGQGKNLVESQFVRGLDDDGLLAFLKRGRPTSDPLNTTKVDMPPKGGNPALSEDDLLDIISYVRSLQKPAAQ